jgi:4-carboxymuconolactone decarboxylase
VTTRLPALTPATLTAGQRELYDEIASGPRAQGPQHFPLLAADGSLRGPFNAFLFSPAVGRALQAMGAAIRFESGLADRMRELAILLVAHRWDSAFEIEAHEAVGRSVGLTEVELAALRAGDVSAFDGAEAVAARIVVDLLDGDLDDAMWASGVASLGEPALVELSTLVGYYATLALQLRVFRVG